MCSIVGVSARASSTAGLSAAALPRRQPPSAVMTSLRLGVVDAAAERLGREAAEDDRVRRADPGAGQHRDRQLGDHRHVDGDPVAGRDAQLEQGVGGLADLALEVGVGDRPGVARLADPVVRDLVAEAALDVPVDAVVGDVELAADEPLGERQVPLEGRVERLDPVDALAGERRPEGLVVGLGLARTGRPSRWPAAVNAGSGGKVRPSARRFSISGMDDGDGSMLTWAPSGGRDWPGHPTAGGRPGALAAGGRAIATGDGHHPVRVRTLALRSVDDDARSSRDPGPPAHRQEGVMTSEPTETPPEPKHLFVLGFPDRHGADRAVAGLKELERSQFLSVRDHAIITQGSPTASSTSMRTRTPIPRPAAVP